MTTMRSTRSSWAAAVLAATLLLPAAWAQIPIDVFIYTPGPVPVAGSTSTPAFGEVIVKASNPSTTQPASGIQCGYTNSTGALILSTPFDLAPNATTESPFTVPALPVAQPIVPLCLNPVGDPPIEVSVTIQNIQGSETTSTQQYPAKFSVFGDFVQKQLKILPLPTSPGQTGCSTPPMTTGGSAKFFVFNPGDPALVFNWIKIEDDGTESPIGRTTVPSQQIGTLTVPTIEGDVRIGVSPSTGLFGVFLGNDTDLGDRDFIGDGIPDSFIDLISAPVPCHPPGL